jgi:hypothetical protein
MPANSLRIKDRELTRFKAIQRNGGIDIVANYKITVKNEGMLPAPAVTHSVKFIGPGTETGGSSEKVNFTEKEKSTRIGLIRSGKTTTSTIKVQNTVKYNKDKYYFRPLKDLCKQNKERMYIKESLSGIILLTSEEATPKLTATNTQCDFDDVDERRSSQPGAVQNVPLTFDEPVSPTEVTVGSESAWGLNGENINQVDNIEVNTGDGGSPRVFPEAEENNPEEPSDLGQVFLHTYTSPGQYTITANAINENGETVGSATYDVTANPVSGEGSQSSDAPLFNISEENTNASVNPGQEMRITVEVENLSDTRATGDIIMNIDGERVDSHTENITSGGLAFVTLRATAPQIDSRSATITPEITAEGVRSNTINPNYTIYQ